jgi:IPT/TIG domain
MNGPGFSAPNNDPTPSAVVPSSQLTSAGNIPTTSGPSTPSLTSVATHAPRLTAVRPTSGPASGGNSVTLTGSGFTDVRGVRFGTNPAKSFTLNSATLITAIAPAGTGTVQVTVTTPAGTSNTLPYSYAPLATLSDVLPAHGPTAGGNTVSLTGSGLTAVTDVRFGATTATSFTVVSDTSLTVQAPPGAAGPLLVTVSTPSGPSNPVVYTYLHVPQVTSISPEQGPVSGGNTVTLTGTDLARTSQVAFGTTQAAFTVLSDTTITATVPAGDAGPTPVTVTTPGGTSAPITYDRLSPPSI